MQHLFDQKSSQAVYATRFSEKGKKALCHGVDAMGNSISVTRVWSMCKQTAIITGRLQSMTSHAYEYKRVPELHIINSFVINFFCPNEICRQALDMAKRPQDLVPLLRELGCIHNLRQSLLKSQLVQHSLGFALVSLRYCLRKLLWSSLQKGACRVQQKKKTQ